MDAVINNIVFLDINKTPYTLSSIMAECVKLKHHTITRLIRKHESDFNYFGKVGFKIQALDSGQNEKIYILNEEQATLLITYLKNTPIVREFKKRLVKEFYKQKEEVQRYRIQRALEKPIHKDLMDCINEWPYKTKWSYKNITDLILKNVTGQNAKQLRTSRGIDNMVAMNLLTSSELEAYNRIENDVKVFIGRNWSYVEIKNELEKGA